MGFSGLSPPKKSQTITVRNAATVEEMMRYKCLISARGNDRASDISWKLASGSVLFTALPRNIETWLMETKLVPDFHFVLIKDDWSDLKEKLDWCRKDWSVCENIAKNAREYMRQFGWENDFDIAKEVMKEYFVRTY